VKIIYGLVPGWSLVWSLAVGEDPILTDAQWAEVAAEVMDAAKLAPRG
jgi:hypothetical protein